LRPAITPTPLDVQPAPKRSKYGNIPVVVDGMRFASKLEARYYERLKERVLGGEVAWFTRQVPFWLEGGVKYVCDFLVVLVNPPPGTNGVLVIDTKGRDTQDSINKRKQVKARYRVDVLVIRS
jgi:hypothetical protein